MSAVLRGIVTARSALALRGPNISQRASIITRPAKEPLGSFETITGMGLFALAILGPSGWILANIDSYKSKE
ncbi:cytochrome c oxidase subunit 8A, mitochondrial [Conger conger]|uniref:cytochrome c oxidase subunit 8A, mitochondrial n=1 Tax=Conger conger TaxID=82655 RepID=UPI002A5AB17B|nr:cytochrome c oxidase subunit 8A, mitochondrial [Conger conger]